MEGNLSINFSVSKEEVLKRIATNSYYRGERIKDESGAHAARMQSGDDNNDIINDEIQLAVADVVAMITRNLGRCTAEEGGCLMVNVGGQTWRLVATDDRGNYTRKSDGKNIYIEGDIGIGRTVALRDTAAGVMYEGVISGYDEIIFNLRAASNFPEELKSSVEGAVTAYIFDKALEGWVLVNMPAEVNNLAQRSAQDAEKLRLLLVERKKPMR